MNKLGIKGSKKPISQSKQDALDAVMDECDYLSGETHKARYDIDKHLHKQMKKLLTKVEHVEALPNGEMKVNTVTGRMLLTESILDVLNKYERGDGEYQFQSDESYEFKDK